MSTTSDIPLTQPVVEISGEGHITNRQPINESKDTYIDMGVAFPTDKANDAPPIQISPDEVQSIFNKSISSVFIVSLAFSGYYMPQWLARRGVLGKVVGLLWLAIYGTSFVIAIYVRWLSDGFLDSAIHLGFLCLFISSVFFCLFHMQSVIAVLGKGDPGGVHGCNRWSRIAGIIAILLPMVSLSALLTMGDWVFGIAASPSILMLANSFAITLIISRGLVRNSRLLYTQAVRAVEDHNMRRNSLRPDQQPSQVEGSLRSVIAHHSVVTRMIWWVSRKLSPTLVPPILAMSLSSIALGVTGFWQSDVGSRMSIWIWTIALLLLGLSFLFPLAWVTEASKNAFSRVGMLVSSSETGMRDGSRTALLTQMLTFNRGMELMGMQVALSFLVKLFYFLFSIVLFASRFI